MLKNTAYICSPFRADTTEQKEKQLVYTRTMARKAVMEGFDVIVPHLYYPLFLNDDNEVERELGMNSALNLIMVCDVLIVCEKYGISSGMKTEIEFADKMGIKIKRV